MKHKLELQQAGSGDHFNGRCTCGQWTVYPGRWHDSKKEVKKLFRLHLEKTHFNEDGSAYWASTN